MWDVAGRPGRAAALRSARRPPMGLGRGVEVGRRGGPGTQFLEDLMSFEGGKGIAPRKTEESMGRSGG